MRGRALRFARTVAWPSVHPRARVQALAPAPAERFRRRATTINVPPVRSRRPDVAAFGIESARMQQAIINPGSQSKVGQVLSNRWKLIKLLGEGGMGAVYEAEGAN